MVDVQFLALGAGGLSAVVADALVVVLVPATLPKALDAPVAKLLTEAIAHGDLALRGGSKLYVHRPAGLRVSRLAVVVAADDSAKAFKLACAVAFAMLPAGAKHAAVAMVSATQGLGEAHAQALTSAAADATYLYRHTKPSAVAVNSLAKVSVLGDKAQAAQVKAGVSRGNAIALGVTTARELANRPGNHCTPTYLGEEAKRIAKRYGFKVQVLGRKEIERLGMGSFLSVAQGSTEPPRFIVMQYHGAASKAAPHVLVGKGITFDTGGISLKPGAEMDEMKFDMGGAASVLGTMAALGELKPSINVVALIPTCENMPAGNALKPGDVVKSMSGQTIEVLNTDAEGRLILCDALTYAERFKPASVVDIATLTGACVIALGHHLSGLFSPDDALANALLAAGQAAIDPAWRMPLAAEYDEGLKSNFADMANIAGRAGGSVTAAMFLKRYTSKYRWAHLDIAGTAWKSGPAKGATGRPVGLLTHYLLAQAH